MNHDKKVKLSQSNRLIIKEALSRGIKMKVLDSNRFTLTDGSKLYKVKKGKITLSFNSRLARRCTDMKEVTSRLLRSKGFPAPENAVFGADEPERAWKWAEPVLPVVLKPSNATLGKLVYVHIHSYEEFVYCFNKISESFNEVLIEQFVDGEEFRFTFIKGNIVAVANRCPANVVGDGNSTVQELIKQKNLERKKRNNPIHKKLSIDEETIRILSLNGLRLNSIPDEGRTIYLRRNSNVSTGGDAIDVTDQISLGVKNLVAQSASSIPGLKACGIDVIINQDAVFILEINAHPMLAMHHFPWEGKPCDVASNLIDAMFPESKLQ